ncbi:hypothetical protein Micbo1qcDRAFT_5316 [Microdochium bolleyi]|uniref:Uncharacterized protein n=1 Tax=Microdochium bolleyi TaxID=196109 RepID=A0A136JIY7_9PEZI|nr:hypothetical protein Micbo1qcDRAFT_5316 [Microdochium bolleyi]
MASANVYSCSSTSREQLYKMWCFQMVRTWIFGVYVSILLADDVQAWRRMGLARTHARTQGWAFAGGAREGSDGNCGTRFSVGQVSRRAA